MSTNMEVDGRVAYGTNINRPQASLCNTCSELQLERVLSRASFISDERFPKAIKIADVGQYHRRTSASDCPLCHILSRSRLRITQSGSEQPELPSNDELILSRFIGDEVIDIMGNSAEMDRILEQQTSMRLVVAPYGYVASNVRATWLSSSNEENESAIAQRSDSPRPDTFVARAIRPTFDPSIASRWLTYCQRHHDRLCSATTGPTSGLRLIDCYSMTIVPAPPQASYVALSYVWGSSTASITSLEQHEEGTQKSVRLPSLLPATISDAVNLTKKVGFQYLWVDNFCIDQDNPSVKHGQIVQMDSIYENAELTIIAAAGEDPTYGLVGIGRARTQGGQRAAQLGEFEVVLSTRDPQNAIQCSRWSQRAWTLQEAVFSRRRLVFTDDQVYYECNAMHCRENFMINLDRAHLKDKSKFRSILRPGYFRINDMQKYDIRQQRSALSQRRNFHVCRYLAMVKRYTLRDLTRESDSLNAFLGIIRRFDEEGHGISQIWGVPFQFQSGKSATTTEASFVHGLMWYHSNSTPGEQSTPRRRLGFPSWSWVGWSGEVEHYSLRISSTSQSQHPDNRLQSLSLEFEDGLVLSFFDFVRSMDGIPVESNSPRVLRLLAPPLESSSFSVDNAGVFLVLGYPTEVFLSTGPCDAFELHQSLLDEKTRRCVYVAHYGYRCIFLVLDYSDDVWTRVGLLHAIGFPPYIEAKFPLTRRGSTPELTTMDSEERFRRMKMERFRIQ